MLEVEGKFSVESFDELVKLFNFSQDVLERDIYYQHPSRNFLETNEWLRVRSTFGNIVSVTYKGANEKNESGIKSRREIEFTAPKYQVVDLLEILGFKKLVTVEKIRRHAYLDKLHITITLDDVVGLGKFVEIECLINEENKEAAIQKIEDLATKINLTKKEKLGYAEMMLEKKNDIRISV